jgi:hypothetical protein
VRDEALDTKNIYLTKDGRIVGLHAVGYSVSYTYDIIELDGSRSTITTDFMALEKWGNEYDDKHNMLGRGSFRVHQDIEEEAKDFESDGWVRCLAPIPETKP